MTTVQLELGGLVMPEQPVVSADGRRIAFVRCVVDQTRDSYVRAVCVVESAGGPAADWTEGPHDFAPAWTHQGLLRFLRRCEGSIAVCEASEAQEMKSVGELPESIRLERWSPDGSLLAFVQGSVDAGFDVLIWDQTDVVRTIASFDRPVLDLAWSPDAAGITALVPHGETPETTDITVVMALDPDGEHEPVLIGGASGHLIAVGFTASGERIAVGRVDTAVGPAHLVSCRETGCTTPVEPSGLGSVRQAVPGCTGYDLLVTVRTGPTTRLRAIQLGSAAYVELAPGDADVLEVSHPSRSGVVAAVVRTSRAPGELLLVDVAKGDGRELGIGCRAPDTVQRRRRVWTMPDGRQIDGWLLSNGRRTESAPLLLDLHPGPHTSWTGTLEPAHLYHEELVRRGWTVLLPNLSGSDGYGEEHLRRVLGQWGVPDSAEAWTIIDQLEAEGIADPRRLAVCGFSYGGFLANTMITQNSRFAAAVVGNATADLAATVAKSDLGEFVARFEIQADPEDDPALYSRLSPSTLVARVRTPVLVMHASEDRVVPPDQAQHWYEALVAEGVPTEYVLLDGADHEFLYSGRPSHRDTYYKCLIDWLERFVPSTSSMKRPA